MRKKVLKYYTVLIVISLFFTGCYNDLFDGHSDGKSIPIDKILFPDGFQFSTTRTIDIQLTAPDFLKGSIFEIGYRNFENKDVFILKGTFDKKGKYNMKIAVPAIEDSVFIVSRSFGLEKLVTLPILENNIKYDYNVHYDVPRESDFKTGSALKSAQVDAFKYMGSYTANGYPGYLFKVNDHAWESLLSNLNQTLPEGVSVPQTKPSFLESGKQSNLILREKSKVYITFAGEGTTRTSALGYFIHQGSKPVNLEHIIIFPNASMPGSGGSLHSGDQVYLGEFPANTEIGWFLVPNGWDKNNKTVSDNEGVYYSVSGYNTEPNPAINQHMILMKDIQNEVIVLGFEDTPRISSLCDNDFNDAVFYITLDKLSNADLSNVNNTISPVDTDGDGIIDSLDQYPLDPDKAFNNGGGSGSTGSLAFEDLWPEKGDYDFNDIVVDYQFNPVTDANNLIKTIDILLTVKNVGGTFRNGFGIELPLPASSVKSVTGPKYTQKYLNIASNGVESGRPNAIIFFFDDGWKVKGQSLTVSVTFNNPVDPLVLGSYPYNPFIVADETRGREIHLPDKPPTSGADPSYFGKSADYTRPSMGLYYRSSTNLPWAVNIVNSFTVPAERKAINLGYLKFVDWAKSAGSLYTDWYLDLPGYRDYSFLY